MLLGGLLLQHVVSGSEARRSDYIHNREDHLHRSYDCGSLCTIHKSPHSALRIDWVYLVCWSDGDSNRRGLFLPGWSEGVLALYMELVYPQPDAYES